MKRPKLIVMASTYPRWEDDSVPGFVQEYVQELAGDFSHIHVIVPHYKGAASKEQFEDLTVRRFRYAVPARYENIAYGQFRKTRFYPLKAASYMAAEFWATCWALVRYRGAIVNAHWLIPQGFVAILAKYIFGIRVVVSIHGADVFTLNGGLMRRIKRFTLQHADAVVCNSSATKAACEALYTRDYATIPMGVNLMRFTQDKKRRPASHITELLFVGRVTEEKGIRDLLAAMKELKKRDESVHLTIVGSGSLDGYAQNYVTEHKLASTVSLVGWVSKEELPARYAQADIFVGPSIQHSSGWQEAFGVVFIEAAAMGLPIITTHTGGISDIVSDMKNGLIVPQKDSRALADAILKLALDKPLRERLGSTGRTMVQERYSWDTIRAAYVKILKP